MTDISIGYSHLYLCGHLNLRNEEVLSSWDHYTLNDADAERIGSMFYENYIGSCINKDSNTKTITGPCEHRSISLNRDCGIFYDDLRQEENPDASGVWNMRVVSLHLFRFTNDISLYAIEISEESGKELNLYTKAHFILRNVDLYPLFKRHQESKSYLDAISPLMKLCELDGIPHDNHDYKNLTKTGNKLKLYQMINVNKLDDELLYEFGTVSPVGCTSDKSSDLCPSETYYNSLMNNNTISVFNN